jgi:hypothetical protein
LDLSILQFMGSVKAPATTAIFTTSPAETTTMAKANPTTP